MKQQRSTFTLFGEIDREADSAYIPFREIEDGKVTGNIMIEDSRLAGYVVLDLDKDNRLVGIELIGVSDLVNSDIAGLRD